MAQLEKELEKQLVDTGNKLLSPPSSVTELLALLDCVESYLARVEQSPSESMKKALSASMRPLIADTLLRHSDIDVKVAVASCISEITRITAPEAPYNDDKMKAVFQLIVSSFEKLDDISSPSYIKRISILETVAKVRSCVVMLDLECDALILEMFRHFFRSIRDDHPEIVFSSMETIMALVLDESEDVSLDLLSSILDFLKLKDKGVLPIARQLAEKVIETCANKLKPYLLPAVKSRGGSLDDYSKVVANVCRSGLGTAEPNNGSTAKKHLVALETQDVAPPNDVGPTSVGFLKSDMSNDSFQKEIKDTLTGDDSPKEANLDTPNLIKTDEGPSKSIAEEPAKLHSEEGKSKKRKRKSKASKSLSKPSEPSLADGKEMKVCEHEEKDSKDTNSAKIENLASETAEPAKNENELDVPVSSQKTLENVSADAPSTSHSDSPVTEKRFINIVRGKEKEDVVEESEATGDIDFKESDAKATSEGPGVSGTKSRKRSKKKGSSASEKDLVAAKMVDDNKLDLDAKSAKESGKKLKVVCSQHEDKKGGQVKGSPAKDIAKTPSKDVGKNSMPKSAANSTQDESDVEKVSKTSSKRKQKPDLESASKSKGYGSELVGSKVKVWWPADKEFYEGVVESFDPVKRKHKVKYVDGDVEVLKLKKEKWQLIDDFTANQEHLSNDETPNESSKVPKGKRSKTSVDPGSKRGKTESAAKRGNTSSSKSKASEPKSGRKQKDDSKSKKESSKSVDKSDEVKVGKSKQLKADDNTPKSVRKSKDDDGADTLKGSNKSKTDASKGSVKSKGKSPKSDIKSNTKSTGKEKSGSSATKDKDAKEEEKDEVLPKASVKEKSKGKSPKSDIKSNTKSAGKEKSGSSAAKDKDVKEGEKDEVLPKASVKEKSKGKSPKSVIKSNTKRTGKEKSGSSAAKDKDVKEEEKDEVLPKASVKEKSKGKSPKSDIKSNTKSTGKEKLGSLAAKDKDAKEAEKDEEVSPKASVKEKSPNTSKSEKSARKRKRGTKS